MDESNHAVEPQQPVLILDTNIWLDLLVFRDPTTAALNRAVTAGRARILAGNRARDEFADVISRPMFGLNSGDQSDCLRKFDSIADLIETTPMTPTPASITTLHCSDPDDQQFLDLAVSARANFLLSKDKALLKLARRAWQGYRLQIMTLADWNLENAALHPHLN